MKKNIAFHPPLIALYPILAVYAANMSLWSWSELGIPSAIALVSAAFLWLIGGLITRSWAGGALIASSMVASFFLFQTLVEWIGVFGWIVVTTALMALSAWPWRSLTLPTRFLNAASVILMILSLGSIAQTSYRIKRAIAPKDGDARLTSASAAREALPDVYYIVLDGYGRADELDRVLGIDNQPFLKQLEKLGFFVCADSYSNYCQTEISLASSLNMAFIDDFFKPTESSTVDRAVLDQTIDDSAVARQFRANGYVYLGITTGFPALEFNSADITLPSEKQRMLLGATLIQMTPLRASGQIIMSQFDERRELLRAGIDALGSLNKRGSRPRFVVAHILAPHPPFVFGPNGDERRPKMQFAYADGSHYFENGGTERAYRQGYRDQLEWLNVSLLPKLKEILKMEPAPIVILQGDHGSKLGLDQESASKTDLKEAFANLMAVRVPDSMRNALPLNLTPVNLFRILLRRLFGTDLPPLPNRSLYSPWSRPLQFTDVTDKLGETTFVQEPSSVPRP